MPPRAAARMLLVKKGGSSAPLDAFVDWIWMSAMMIVWILLIAVIGYAAVLVAWRQTDSPGRHGRPKSA